MVINMKVLCFVLCLCFVVIRSENLLELARKAGASSLVKLVNIAGLDDTLSEGGPYTLFGPSDDAIALLPRAVLERLMSDRDYTANMLRYHMVSGHVYLSQLTDEMLLSSLYKDQGKPVAIRFNTYRDGLIKVADGRDLINYLSNQNASNGVLHMLERVMFPYPLRDIPTQLKLEQSRFSTLYKALQTAYMEYTLSGGPFTIFAPTDAAFQKLPYTTMEKLMANTTALRDVLMYHVLQGSMWRAGLRLLDRETVKTLEGHSLTVTYDYVTDHFTMNNARVVEPDLPVTNGAIHVIDTVLLPPTVDLDSL